MSTTELFLIAVGLSMDAFAVSVCKGMAMDRIDRKQALALACSFGFFQAAMPLLGYFAGEQFLQAIKAVDHWIAFGLLAMVGGKMIHDAFHPEEEETGSSLTFAELLFLSVATSIDALAIGLTFSLLGDIAILPACGLIGITTFCLSLAGVLAGHLFGRRFEAGAQIFGGILLILLGLKILLEHLGLF